uniref:Uncharacterized protein n=1 Tax=Alexandrium monilatum TaxID=311494 RepID=A0A7S4R6S9_9DINO|mmetsp:Transcript_30159/g.95078  ORF Transcript_30159/g.95078 Transcript_30159/m.95078 type:complete len:313 (+) Transcript_30159:75-1013(+)
MFSPIIDWDAIVYPGYRPVQFDPSKFTLPLGCCDWWGPRSWLCGPAMPCIRCCHGRCNPCLVSQVDITDPTIWKATLELPTSCPESMKGVWWLCDNVAAETLVCFNEGRWTKLEAPGEWSFQKDLPQTWTRDDAVFGGVLGAVNAWSGVGCCNLSAPWNSVTFTFNLDAGKAKGDDTEYAWRIDDDEWQKLNFRGAPGETGGDEIFFMYRWRRVIRGDGSTTPAFQELRDMVTSPYPHRNCCEPWCCLWPLCISKEQRLKDMAYSNRKQLVIWPPAQRRPVCSCWGARCSCPCMCPCAKDATGAHAEREDAR